MRDIWLQSPRFRGITIPHKFDTISQESRFRQPGLSINSSTYNGFFG
jgi:hypothetical protein